MSGHDHGREGAGRGRAASRPALHATVAAAAFVALVVGAPLGSLPATAAPLLDLLDDPSATQPYVGRGLAASPAAAYLNPSLLFDVEERFALGLVFLSQLLDVDLAARPGGVDVPASVYDARVVTPDGTARLGHRPLPTADLRSERGSFEPRDDRFFLSIGGVIEPVDDRLAFGFFVVFPLREFQLQRPFFVDEREQYFSNSLHFEMYEDRLAQSAFVFALAGRPVDWLTLGAGVTMANAAEPHTHIFIPDATDQRVTDVNAEVTIRTRLVPHFALAVAPLPELRVSTTVHLAYGSDVEGDSELQLWNYPYAEGESALTQSFDFRYGSLPLRVGLAASWSSRPGADDAGGVGWQVGADVRWSQWSEYRDRQRDRPIVPWSDTWTVSAGGGVTLGDHEIGAGLRWEPSPVPRQDGRTNYVDNDRIAFGGGWRGRFPLSDAIALVARAQVQAQRLIPRSVTKSADADVPVIDELPDAVDVRTDEPLPGSAGLQTNNPGYPGFSSEGWLLAVGLSLGVVY